MSRCCIEEDFITKGFDYMSRCCIEEKGEKKLSELKCGRFID